MSQTRRLWRVWSPTLQFLPDFGGVSGEFPRLLIVAQIPCPEEPITLIRMG